jgi:uncharacterized protein YhbP (UPF0306 family)
VTLSSALALELEPVRTLLEETSTLVLATRSADGTPRATPVYFAADAELRLIFLSDPGSIHSLNADRDGRASVALYPEEADWRRLRGLQMAGSVRKLGGAEAEAARVSYARRFPFIGQLAEALAASAVYAFQPTWIRLIDNRTGFGFQQEWSLG